MGLLNDTIRDARRPLGVHRIADTAESVELADAFEAATPVSEFSPESPPGGAHSISRFQKEGQALPREASFQSGGGIIRLPAGDPLLAEMDVERPKSSATNVGFNDISVMGDNRESELETGHEEHRSPGKVAAANVKSESKTHQSEVLSGSIETESYHETHQSNTPEGSEQRVSRQGETFLSRLPGRGAPSETFSEKTAAASWRPAHDAPHDARAAVRHDGAATTASAVIDRTAPERARATATRTSAPPLHASRPATASARAPEAEPPGLVIGRIDVLVVADGAPAQPRPAAPALAERGFLSRNYLKRL